jgi:hypothetical protein
MHNLRIENKDIYTIQVNDKGDCIQFDLADISLKAKCYEALENLETIGKKYQELFKQIKTDKEMAIVENQMFKEMRNAMDIFLGENACQKIYGDRNYYDMFNDLMAELSKKRPELKGKSHFDMLSLNSQKIQERIMKKYQKNVKNVI